ncbi:MAG: 2-succinyl-5-enolpyruvyl-6-hydroxy-3-cyclohexene-1-carboxylic-acid synthase, partial [Flavobacteriaceae bacterium]|nr:2-succinyl-5-enolpyruvyl-6-hydroxy-3-cyclohexene-1-carboxylic-acid synthase [Flavobacteriaceae bacterium]
MIYSQKELAQLVIEHCVTYEVEHVVISPGSRNAPLTIGFTNHPKVKTFSIVDERSAAFFGLGISQQTQKPVALVCTSGSALLNYYPAVAEAFYSDIPLVVISADRPKRLIDIGDGQTIRQENIFINHSLFNANLKEGKDFRNENSGLIEKALATSTLKKGPVHINVPFDEPLYETTTELLIEKCIMKDSIKESDIQYDLTEIAKIWSGSKKKMIIVGSNYPNKRLQMQLSEIVKDESVLILTETTSNLTHDRFINNIDKLIFTLSEEEFENLRPEVLITIGGMVVSKKIKQFLREHQPQHHWYIDPLREFDTYHCLNEHIKMSPTTFFDKFSELIYEVKSAYQNDWLTKFTFRNYRHDEFLKCVEFSDLKVFDIILNSMPDKIHLQLGNSSVIRYSQLFKLKNNISVFCNRGTSGIDGSTSTAIGAACVVKNRTIFITGDISFFYDSNALWNNYIKNDLRIIVINNGGGGIFKILPGPASTNAMDYFETKHQLTAKALCEMNDLIYLNASSEKELKEILDTFFDGNKSSKLLEIFTPGAINDK